MIELKSYKIFVLFIGLISILLVVGCSGEATGGENGLKETITIKYTHGVGATLDDPHQWTAVKFKELVEEYTDGAVNVEIFPAGQLGSEQRGFQDVQNGIVEATSLAVNNATAFAPSLGMFDLPYIFQSRNDFYKVVDQLWDKINDQMIEESGNRAIIWFDQGFRVITNSERPINNMNDLKGLKIRVPQNPMMLESFNAWGAQPTPISWDETFSALQQGVVDGQENPYSVIYSSKFQEVQEYVTDIHYKMWIGPVVVNEQWLQNLPEEIKEAIIRAGQEASLAVREFIIEKEQETLERLIDAGMQYNGAPADEEDWVEAAMALWPQFYDRIGGTDLLIEVMDVLGRELP